MSQKSSQKGFTIIEVVLVLAIAALIFLVVFLAVPALQRSQRDTQRRADVGRLHTAIVNYAGNRQGQLPTTMTTATAPAWVFQNVRANTPTEKFEDPRGNTTLGGPAPGTSQYRVTVDGTGIVAPPTISATDNAMSLRFGQKCDVASATNATTSTGAGSRNFAVVIALESGDYYCQDN